MQLPINNFTFLVYCTFSGWLAKIYLFPLLTNFNSFDGMQTLGNDTTFAGLGSDMHPINKRMQTVLTVSLKNTKDNALYKMHCLHIYLYGQETVSPLNCTPNHVLIFFFFLIRIKKFTRSDLGNSILLTGCQLSLSNYNRNLQTLSSLCMGTGNLHRVHKRKRTSDFGSDATCHKCLHQVPATSSSSRNT